MKTVCSASITDFDNISTIECKREVGHLGSHQHVMRTDDPKLYFNYVWDAHGAGLTRSNVDHVLWNECPVCSLELADDKDLCYTCDFWNMQKSKKGGIVIGGRHYRIGMKNGFDGATFVIDMFDGNPPIVTNELAHQGRIPEHFRDGMPDNAVFVQNDNKSSK